MTVDLPRSYDPSHQNALLAMEALLGHDGLGTSACDDPFPPTPGGTATDNPASTCGPLSGLPDPGATEVGAWS